VRGDRFVVRHIEQSMLDRHGTLTVECILVRRIGVLLRGRASNCGSRPVNVADARALQASRRTHR